MANLGDVFDPNEVPADERNFDPLPEGDYTCQVTESDLVDLKTGNGQALKLVLEVMEGPSANRKLWVSLNIRHTNPQAQSISQRALADLCAAVGVGPISDSEELHFRPFIARVGFQKNDATRNEVKRYRALSGQPPAAKGAPAPARQPAAPAARAAAPTGSRPWARQGA